MKIRFVLFLLILTGLVSCEEKDKPTADELITGTWGLIAAGEDNNFDGEISDDELQAPSEGETSTVIFNADKTGTITDTWPDGESSTGEFAWELQDGGKTLKITSTNVKASEPSTASILELKMDKLTLFDEEALYKYEKQ